MKILITGGAGYLGTELVARLLPREEVEKVIVYDNLSRNNFNLFLGVNFEQPQKLHFVNGDLLDSRNLSKCLEDIDVVYHLAARVTTPFANTDAHFFEQVNHWGTAELVYAVEESQVRKLIFVSSTAVYGRAKELADENKIPNPQTFYGISKLRAEDHVRRLSDRIDTYILRCGNVYGYSKSARFDAVINRFMFDANFNNRVSIDGDGKQSRAFIHIDAITKALTDLILAKVPSGTYNLVQSNFQVLEIVDVLKEIYPDLEFIFINQHLSLRDLKIDLHSKLNQYLTLSAGVDLKKELWDFKQRLSFG